MNLKFSLHIFEKYSNINFYENPSSGSRVVPCGRTDGRTDGPIEIKGDGHNEAASRISQFFERA